MSAAVTLLEFLVFPGLLFTAAAGLVTSWVDRKVTARVQMRAGPPFFQPFYDIGKLLIKETCVPAGGSIGLFLLAITLAWIRAVARLNVQFLALTAKDKSSNIEMK